MNIFYDSAAVGLGIVVVKGQSPAEIVNEYDCLSFAKL